MPGIQDIYSVNVSNRYDISYLNNTEEDDENEAAADYDPLDALKNLEDEKKRAQEEAKKKKLASGSKGKTTRKVPKFQEIKESNVPPKKESAAQPKSAKPNRSKDENVPKSEGTRLNNKRGQGDKQSYPVGDENRRPPRRRNDQAMTAKSGEGDQMKGNKEESFGSFGRTGGGGGGGSAGGGSYNDSKNDRRERTERFRGGRGGYRGTGFRGTRNYGGGHRNDGRDERGKREFDRRSGSDRSSVRPSDKRDGAGPRNWGTPGNEIEEATEPAAAGNEEVGNWADQVEADDKETPKKEEAGEDVEEATEEKEVKEEEPAEMTLDEWKAMQVGQQKNPSFNLRKAGEGENTDQWKNMKVIHKSYKEDIAGGNINKEQPKRAAKGPVNVNTNFRFGDNEGRGRGGFARGRARGDRGGRGRGQRGQRYGPERSYGAPRGNQSLPDVQNEVEFPTLG